MSSDNHLGGDVRPRFFAVRAPERRGLAAPVVRQQVGLRTYARSLAVMQKEALVVSSAAEQAWRLVSDEGSSLGGHEEAPFPLAFLNAGLLASYAHELTALAQERSVAIDDLRMTLDSFYTMEGSALRGTMVGQALDPRLHVELATAAPKQHRLGLCADAVQASPVNGLLRGAKTNLFSLTHNGRQLPADGVGGLPHASEMFDAAVLDDLPVDGPESADQLMQRLPRDSPGQVEDGDDAGSALRAERPKRTLQVRGVCRIRPDGVKVIDVRLAHRSSAVFRFLSDEPIAAGGAGRAPDAATLVSAGIAFCFMTQFGRYAAITKRPLDGYGVVQETGFPLGGGSAGTGGPGDGPPVRTHVYLSSPQDDEYARTVLRMGERTCYLHALCRTDLEAELTCSEPERATATGEASA